MYHKESGTGNDPFLAGNMLCRRWSLSPLSPLSPLRISALINLPRLFLPAKETYHLDWRCTTLWQASRAYSALSGCYRFEISRGMLREKSVCPYESRPRCQNATRKPPRPLLLQYTSCVGKHRVSVNCDNRKLEESNSLFVPCKIAKHVVTTFFCNIFREYLDQSSREKEISFVLSTSGKLKRIPETNSVRET